jgi:hydroxypyruvate isomerase
VADAPHRCEPGTGEIHHPAIAARLDRLGYRGVVALQGWASSDPAVALERFRSAFMPPCCACRPAVGLAVSDRP